MTSTRSADCYGRGDRGLMQLSQRVRGWLLYPVLRGLARLGITANGLSMLSLLAGLAFCPLLLVHRGSALALLALHIGLDGLDGPLARHTGTASSRGSFTDTVADQVVVAASTAGLIHAGVVDVLPGVVYLFAYTVVVAFAVVRNALAIPYTWLIRPRLLVYALIPVDLFAWSGCLDLAMAVSSVLLAIKAITGFASIRRRL